MQRHGWRTTSTLFLVLCLFGLAAFVQPDSPNSSAVQAAVLKPTAAAPAAQLLPVEKLLPARTVVLSLDEGFVVHRAGWDKTAASDSLSKTGVFDVAQLFLNTYISMLEADGSTTAETKQTIRETIAAIQSLSDHGYAVAVSLPEGNGMTWPRLTVVVPRGGSIAKTLVKLSETTIFQEVQPQPTPAYAEDSEDECQPAVEKAKPAEPAKPDAKTEQAEKDGSEKEKETSSSWKKEQIGTREIFTGGAALGMDMPGLDVAFWDEQGHFVFVVGFGAVKSTLAVVDGKAPNITTNAIWKELHQGKRSFERRAFGWIDVKELRSVYDDAPLAVPDVGGTMMQFLEVGEELFEGLFGVALFPFAMVVQQDFAPVAAVQFQQPDPIGVDFDIPLNGPQVVQIPEFLPAPPGAVLIDANGPEPILLNGQDLPQAPLVLAAFEAPQDAKTPEDPEEAPPTEAPAAQAMTVKQVLTSLGLDTVQHYTWQSGYKGRALWAESFLSAPGQKRGLLGLANQPPIKFEQLPPLPVDTIAFSATSIDLKNITQATGDLLRSLAPMVAGTTTEKVEEGIKEWRATNGELFDELVGAVDPVVCLYNDGTNGPLSIGPVLVWKVKDAAKLRKGLDKLVAMISPPTPPQTAYFPANPEPADKPQNLKAPPAAAVPQAADAKKVPSKEAVEVKDLKEVPPAIVNDVVPLKADVEKPVVGVIKKADVVKQPDTPPVVDDQGEPVAVPPEGGAVDASTFKVVRKTRYGRELVGIQTGDYPLGIVYTVDDQWLAISLNSQLIEAFLLRVDGKLARWEPTTAHREALSELPDQFTSISVDDPRKSLPQVVSLGYCALTWIEATFRSESSFLSQSKKLLENAPNLPPAELVVQPLFPNLSVTTVDATGVHWYSRTSLPALSSWNYVMGYFGLTVFANTGLIPL